MIIFTKGTNVFLKKDGSRHITADWDIDGAGTLFIDIANARVGINTVTPLTDLHINGKVNIGTNLAGLTNVYDFVVNSVRGGIILNRDHAVDPAFIRMTSNIAGSGGQIRTLGTGGLMFTDFSSVVELIRFYNPTTDEAVLRIGTGNSKMALGYSSRAGVDSPCIMAADASGNLDRIFQRVISNGDVYIGDIDPNGGDVIFRANAVNEFKIEAGGAIYMYNLKSGSDQANAGAAVNEIWKTSGHASLPDNVLMIGA